MDDENTVKIEVETPAAENTGGVSDAVADATAVLAVAEVIANKQDNGAEYRAIHERIDGLYVILERIENRVGETYENLRSQIDVLSFAGEVTQEIVAEVADAVTDSDTPAEVTTESVVVEETPPANSDAPETRTEEVKTRTRRWV